MSSANLIEYINGRIAHYADGSNDEPENATDIKCKIVGQWWKKHELFCPFTVDNDVKDLRLYRIVEEMILSESRYR